MASLASDPSFKAKHPKLAEFSTGLKTIQTQLIAGLTGEATRGTLQPEYVHEYNAKRAVLDRVDSLFYNVFQEEIKSSRDA